VSAAVWLPNFEVDGVEGVQKFCPQFNVHPLADFGLLDDADVKPSQAWTVQYYVAKAALARIRLCAPVAVWRRDVSSSGSALSSKPGSGRIERPLRVQDYVVGQEEDHSAGILSDLD